MYKKILIIVILICSLFIPLCAIDFDFGISPCLHFPSINDFYEVYPNNRFAVNGTIGVRSEDLMILFKHQYFQTKGNSIIENAQLDGIAVWKQHISFIGLRYYYSAFNHLFYSNMGLLKTFGNEFVTTNEEYKELTAKNQFQAFGFGIGMGIDIPINSFVKINPDVEYGFIFTKSQGGIKNNSTINIGGFTASLGLIYYFSMKNDKK